MLAQEEMNFKNTLTEKFQKNEEELKKNLQLKLEKEKEQLNKKAANEVAEKEQ